MINPEMDILEYYKTRTSKRRRESWEQIKNYAHIVERSGSRQACQFFTRENDFEQVKAMNVGRYAMTLVDAGKSDEDFQTTSDLGRYLPYLVANDREALKFHAGIYENVCIGVGPMICQEIANTFTSWGQQWKFLKSGGTSTAKEVEALIQWHREFGLFDSRIVETDFIKSAVDSAAMHIYMKGDELAYDVVWPSSIQIAFGRTVHETLDSRGKEEIPRSVDTTDIEDATAVVLCLSGTSKKDDSGILKNTYLGYVGSNEDYPEGRMVRYQASEAWPIPDPGDEAKILSEYERVIGGKKQPCNPLTFVARNGKGGIGGGYEYPIIILRGDQRFGSNELLPYSDTFYKNCLEIESMWAQIAHQGVKVARGKDVITLSAAGDALPDSLDILVVPPGCQYKFEPGNATGVAQAIETAVALTRGVAASRGVPSYVVVGPVPEQPESGIALSIRTQPLINTRDRSTKMNRGQVARIFDIEAGLMYEALGGKVESLLKGVKQNWDPGPWIPPKDESTETDELIKKRDGGLIDHFQALRESNKLPTIQDAINLDREYSKRDRDYESADQKTFEKKQMKNPTQQPTATPNASTNAQTETEEQPEEEETEVV